MCRKRFSFPVPGFVFKTTQTVVMRFSWIHFLSLNLHFVDITQSTMASSRPHQQTSNKCRKYWKERILQPLLTPRSKASPQNNCSNNKTVSLKHDMFWYLHRGLAQHISFSSLVCFAVIYLICLFCIFVFVCRYFSFFFYGENVLSKISANRFFGVHFYLAPCIVQPVWVQDPLWCEITL